MCGYNIEILSQICFSCSEGSGDSTSGIKCYSCEACAEHEPPAADLEKESGCQVCVKISSSKLYIRHIMGNDDNVSQSNMTH